LFELTSRPAGLAGREAAQASNVPVSDQAGMLSGGARGEAWLRRGGPWTRMSVMSTV